MSVPIKPVTAYRFCIIVNGVNMGFRMVSGIAREAGIETYQEGGLNDRVHIFPKPGGEAGLSLEKGVYYGDRLPFYLVGERLDSLYLSVLSNEGKPLKSYMFSGVLVRRWEVGEMSAENSGVLIERFEVSYEEFYLVS